MTSGCLGMTGSHQTIPAPPILATHPAASSAERGSSIRFTDVTEQAGLRFKNEHGSSLPLTIVETTGGGACSFDYDNDGWLDIYLISEAGENRLFRNNGDGTFSDVTRSAGVGDAGHYHMGCCAADIDNDGLVDLYLTNYDRNTLLRNRGDGTFEDRTDAAGVGDQHWSVSCAFLDYDRDGLLDLYVANYLDFSKGPRLCRRGNVESNCPPYLYPAEPHTLYHNEGGGRFMDATRAAGIAGQRGRGMGVVSLDFNNDGWPDLVVVNDSDPNFLFRNEGDGSFREVGLLAGTAYTHEGRVTSSMGVDFADYDFDGHFDFVVTNFQHEVSAFYRNLGHGLFAEQGARVGLEPTRPYVGWGVGFVDFDNDGDKDLLFANGHVHHNISAADPASSFAQRPQLFENRDGLFLEVSAAAGPRVGRGLVGRGAVFGDFDNDGDIDVLINCLGEGPRLLRNDGGQGNHWLTIELIGAREAGRGSWGASRSAVGSRVVVTSGGRRQMDEVRAGGSYASSNDPRLHFGLGRAREADVEIHWLGGGEESLKSVPADQFVVVRQGRGVGCPPRIPARSSPAGDSGRVCPAT